MSRERVTWSSVKSRVRVMSHHVQQRFDPDVIVGISRGGLPGAVVLTHLLGVPLKTVEASYYDGQERQSEVTTGTVDIPSDADVVIFDDIVETGETMSAIEELVKHATSGEVHTVSIHVKPGRKMTPDIWLEETENWVVYPWEATEIPG